MLFECKVAPRLDAALCETLMLLTDPSYPVFVQKLTNDQWGWTVRAVTYKVLPFYV